MFSQGVITTMCPGRRFLVSVGHSADPWKLLAAWSRAGTLLRCEFRFRWFAACFRARIRLLTEDRIELLSDDTRSELVLPLPPTVTLGLGEFVPMPPPDDAADYGEIVVVRLRTTSSSQSEPDDEIYFIEVKQD